MVHMQKSNEKKTPYRGLFVTDLDGTLLTDRKNIAAADLKALQHLRARGVLVAIATGRSNYSFNKLIQQLECTGLESALAVDYVIVSTGAGLMTFPDSRIVTSFTLSGDEVFCISEYLENHGLDYMIHKPVPETMRFLYRSHGGENPDFHARLEMYKEYSTPFLKSSVREFGKATEVVCIVPAENGHDLADKVMTDLSQFSVIRATSPLDGESVWIEIFPSNVSKSQTTQVLAERMSIQHQNICAVGNDFNDDDLLQWVEHGYLVSNGPSSMKEKLHVVGSNNESGVREAIDHWLGNNLFL